MATQEHSEAEQASNEAGQEFADGDRYPVLMLSPSEQDRLLQQDPEKYLDSLPTEVQAAIEWAFNVHASYGRLDDFDPLIRRVLIDRGGVLHRR